VTLLQKHLEIINDRNYDLDFRNLYHFHNDTWITKGNESYIQLSKMTTSHIENSLEFIGIHGPLSCYGLGALWVPKLKKELKRREK